MPPRTQSSLKYFFMFAFELFGETSTLFLFIYISARITFIVLKTIGTIFRTLGNLSSSSWATVVSLKVIFQPFSMSNFASQERGTRRRRTGDFCSFAMLCKNRLLLLQ